MSVSREVVRDRFASLLTTALVGSGLPAQAVYNYQVGDFGGASPVVIVSSGPIQREANDVSNSCWRATIVIDVYVFVLYAATGWTEAQAEDAMDAIEAAIATVVLTNTQQAGYWNYATYAEQPTRIDGVEIGGAEYKRELIQVTFDLLEG